MTPVAYKKCGVNTLELLMAVTELQYYMFFCCE